ncbi:MAG TPA: NAD(P)-dependent oxidoreductase, partial [Caulobacteraceae bacterium]|nr:NAD(P)-dependent oxidoreductase [Caulobacteraceae bacterium]
MGRGWGPVRTVAVCVGAALLVGFGFGYWTGRTSPAPSQSPSSLAWPFFGKPRAADAPRAGPAKPEGFAVWKTAIDTSGADPLSCITLTRPLDPSVAYSDFVAVNPSLGHPVSAVVRGDALCVAGLGFSGHRVTLLKGLPARTGERLQADQDVDFADADQPPYVGFDGLGVILPREESDGLGIDTVNVSRLHVEVWREVDRNLVRHAIEAPDPTPEGQYSYEGDNDARQVWAGDITVSAPAGQRAVTVFPLGAVLKEMKPGAYLINTSRGALIDEGALADALRTGQIAGAALDVLSSVPPPADLALLGAPNLIVTPHAAFYSDASIHEVQTRAASNVATVLSGDVPEHVVNPDVLAGGSRRAPAA